MHDREDGVCWGEDVLVCCWHAVNVRAFRAALIGWGREHFRAFPWRLTRDPYRILIAELMLHRTQALQVVDVYGRFVERYPDLASLARAAPEEVYRLLRPLGLNWRIEAMIMMAFRLMTEFGGAVPEQKEALLMLPGVGDYVASAVRCFAWGHPEPLVDTNTVRVAGRLFGLPVRDSSRRDPRFRRLIGSLLDRGEPRVYNYALIDLAKEVCTGGQHLVPSCGLCPVNTQCAYVQRRQPARVCKV